MKLQYKLIKTEDRPVTAPDKHIRTVSEITRNIRFVLEEQFANIWVEGEVSNFKLHSSGHMYFSLKDEESQIACVMFRRENSSLGFEMQEGAQVICFGRVSVYGPRGQYQLYVERVEPKGVGALQLRFQQLKEKLKREGLFDTDRKRTIPFLPGRVALVTSTDGAALRDILQVLDRRFSTAHLLIYPVGVQGAQAAPDIAQAIEDLNRNESADVMILARGGGSPEDLWAFNEEIVARAIFHSHIPVISAIGHETDFTIAEFVAELRAPTPSAAAELVMPRREDLLARLAELRQRSSQVIRASLGSYREDLEQLLVSRALKDPLYYFTARFQRLDELAKALASQFQNFVLTQKEKASLLLGKLDALGPLATLKRGFSVTLLAKDEKVVASVKQAGTGDRLKTRLADGFLISQVTEVQHGG